MRMYGMDVRWHALVFTSGTSSVDVMSKGSDSLAVLNNVFFDIKGGVQGKAGPDFEAICLTFWPPTRRTEVPHWDCVLQEPSIGMEFSQRYYRNPETKRTLINYFSIESIPPYVGV